MPLDTPFIWRKILKAEVYYLANFWLLRVDQFGGMVSNGLGQFQSEHVFCTCTLCIEILLGTVKLFSVSSYCKLFPSTCILHTINQQSFAPTRHSRCKIWLISNRHLRISKEQIFFTREIPTMDCGPNAVSVNHLVYMWEFLISNSVILFVSIKAIVVRCANSCRHVSSHVTFMNL